jgi:hypothetical protein
MTAFGIILILGGLLPLLALARWRPSSLRRPTWWAGLLYLLQLGIAAAWIPSEIESPLVSGSVAIESRIPEQAARLATVSFPACLCLWIVLTPMLDPRPRRTDPEPADGERPATAEVLLLAAALSLVGLGVLSLLSAVSLTDTGLWALLTDPASTVERREATFKLLPSGLVKTIYGHATTVGMPLSVALLVSRRWLSPPALDASLRTGLVALILLAGSLSGARSPAAQLLILAGLVVFIVGPQTPRLGRMMAIGGVALGIVLLLTVVIASAQSTAALTDRVASLAFWVGRRAFSVPFQTGLWHLQYVAEHGSWSFDGIYLPLRTAFGGEYADPGSMVGRWYAREILGRPDLSTTMNTSDLFTMMSATSLGVGLVFSAGLLCLADLLATVARRATGTIGVAMTAILVWLAARSANSYFTGGLMSWLEIAALSLMAMTIGAAIDRARRGPRPTVRSAGPLESPER